MIFVGRNFLAYLKLCIIGCSFFMICVREREQRESSERAQREQRESRESRDIAKR